LINLENAVGSKEVTAPGDEKNGSIANKGATPFISTPSTTMDATFFSRPATFSRVKKLRQSFAEKLGPGMLFAAACVGTSHLVQSTRAGADYGLSLWWVILLACLIKYPTFYFGPAYAAATGESLLESYRRLGRWALALFALELFVNMFIATAAVALITGGLVNSVLALGLNSITMAGMLLALCGALLLSGKYRRVEKVTTLFVVVFTILIVVAVFLAVPKATQTVASLAPAITIDLKTLLFIIAFAGWMPTALGASVFQSLWVCAKGDHLKRSVTPQEARFDFNVGYLGTAFLALCFMLLGTVFMHQQDIVVAASAPGFAGQFMGLFTAAIGNWAYPIIAVAAIACVLSAQRPPPRSLGAAEPLRGIDEMIR